jgi:hypothetical protein
VESPIRTLLVGRTLRLYQNLQPKAPGCGMVIVVYDLSDPDQWQAAHRHRCLWGRLYTDIHALDLDCVALVFRPAPDERWRPWELVRLSWILNEDLEGRAA